VRIGGSVSREALPGALGAADLFVSASRREGFGVALVEALATGLPAVATRSGGPEGIVGEDDGVLVEPGSAEALSDGIADALARLGTFDSHAIAARAHERFSRDVVSSSLVALYRDVVAGARS
jgi:glycosyltransferase involved in cell wall biosynthesis